MRNAERNGNPLRCEPEMICRPVTEAPGTQGDQECGHIITSSPFRLLDRDPGSTWAWPAHSLAGVSRWSSALGAGGNGNATPKCLLAAMLEAAPTWQPTGMQGGEVTRSRLRMRRCNRPLGGTAPDPDPGYVQEINIARLVGRGRESCRGKPIHGYIYKRRRASRPQGWTAEPPPWLKGLSRALRGCTAPLTSPSPSMR